MLYNVDFFFKAALQENNDSSDDANRIKFCKDNTNYSVEVISLLIRFGSITA